MSVLGSAASVFRSVSGSDQMGNSAAIESLDLKMRTFPYASLWPFLRLPYCWHGPRVSASVRGKRFASSDRRLGDGEFCMWLRVLLIPFVWCWLIGPSAAQAAADHDCYNEDVETRIRGCTELLGRSGLSTETRSGALATRALGYSLKRDYGRAIEDYNRSLELIPNFATALNNRAWAYFRWGKAAMGVDDVEKALDLQPDMDAAYDTRAHIRQALGNPSPAMNDYQMSMDFGGERMVLMYQCGLKDHGLYKGPRDGQQNEELRLALKACVLDLKCDPLPSDEFCRPASS